MRENELAQLLEGTLDAAFAVDLQGEIRTWNKAAEALFGHKAEAMLGKQCSMLFAGRTASELPICRADCHVLTCALKGKGVPNFDMQVNTNSGQVKWVNVSILVVANERTDRKFTVHMIRDVEKKKRAEALTNQVLKMSRQLLSTADEIADAPPTISLTDREKEILTLIVSGRSLREIARRLRISDATLRNHISHINQKLNTNNRFGAALQAIRNGLI